MLEHQKRVVAEKEGLDERLAKLQSFIGTSTFKGLNEPERDRLRSQAKIMADYSFILGERIAAFSNTPQWETEGGCTCEKWQEFFTTHREIAETFSFCPICGCNMIDGCNRN